jgi:hypothetical protein
MQSQSTSGIIIMESQPFSRLVDTARGGGRRVSPTFLIRKEKKRKEERE